MVGDLAAALDALAPARMGGVCSVGTYLAGLAKRDPALHARVLELIDDPAVQASSLARALEADGASIAGQTLARHRRRRTAGGCRCPR